MQRQHCSAARVACLLPRRGEYAKARGGPKGREGRIFKCFLRESFAPFATSWLFEISEEKSAGASFFLVGVPTSVVEYHDHGLEARTTLKTGGALALRDSRAGRPCYEICFTHSLR